FEPDRVARQIEPLRRLLEVRDRLRECSNEAHPPEDPEALLRDCLADLGTPRRLAAELAGVAAAGARPVIGRALTPHLAVVFRPPDFQKLEGSWRGLHHLVSNTETGSMLQLQVLNVTKEELVKDVQKALEVDQSQIFKKLYTTDFDVPPPYGLLVGDY